MKGFKLSKIIALLVAATMALSLVTACGGGGKQPAQTTAAAAETTAAATTTAATTQAAVETEAAAAEGADESGLEHYSFTYYFSDEWQTIHPWGVDKTSAKWQKQFNLDIEFSKPDADADAKLNLMIASNDLPDVINMNRGPINLKMVELGMLVELAPFQAQNPNYDKNILKQSQEILKVNGKLYAFPIWPRVKASGGNDCWIYNKRIYEAAGSPQLKTFEDLYAFAAAVKEKVPVNNEGLPVLPFSVEGYDALGMLTKGFYRSYGGFNGDIYGRVGDELQMVLRDPKYRAAIMEANKWFCEGLIVETNFTETEEQIVEKLVAGRIGLLYYGMDRDDVNHFRQLLINTFPDDDYIIVDNPVYPPANGLPPEKIYADAQQTVGGNIACITTAAKQPKRIFDFLSYLYTKDASIEMMYGPKGVIWNELDEDGNPILIKSEADMSADERDDLGMWFWGIAPHSDNVDMTNFAVNAKLPKEKQNWVVWVGANIITPVMFISDEYNGLSEVIDPQSDEGINKTLCENQRKTILPQIIMASSAAEAEKMYDDLIAFCDKNGMKDIEKILNEAYIKNCERQGGTAYTR